MERRELEELFGVEVPLIGVVHLPPLPGSPDGGPGLERVRRRVREDVEALSGADGLIVENFGDAPYHPARVPAHTVAHMSILASETVEAAGVPVGVNVLRNDAAAALSVAAAAGAEFVRANVWTGARVTDQGVVEGRAHRVIRLRRRLGATVRVFADVDVKHSAPLAERPLEQEVREAAGRGAADAVVITGDATGHPPEPGDLEAARRAGDVPVLAGSGVTPANVGEIARRADGLIVGTALRERGDVARPVEPGRVDELLGALREARARR